MHSAFDELWSELEPEENFSCPLRPAVERISYVMEFRAPGYVPSCCDGRTEFNDYSKRPDDYMNEDGEGWVYNFSLGDLREAALHSLQGICPEFTWTEVTRNKCEMLVWRGHWNSLSRIGTLEVAPLWVSVNIFDELETWKVSYILVDRRGLFEDALTLSIKTGGMFAMQRPDGVFVSLPVDLNDGPSLDRHYSDISLDLRDWGSAI